MWHTSRGDRTLHGGEAALVSTAIDTMIDALLVHVGDDYDDQSAAECPSGIAVYDSLTASQRVGLLHDVANHLLTPTDAPLPLSAAAEAAVAAIFVEIRDQVAIEIDLFPQGDGPNDEPDQGDPSWRQLVLSAHRDVCRGPHDVEGLEFEVGEFPDETHIPDELCKDIDQWEQLIESLTDAVLWDRDFEMADSFLDVDPGVSQQRRRLMGIDEEYFTRVAPDPRPDEVFRLVSKTREIVRAKPR